MDIQTIISEADILVPNPFSTADKVIWLNEVNQVFFDVVKIPLVARFNAVTGTAQYTLASGVRAKNIDTVMIGSTMYVSAQYGTVQPGRALWDFDDSTSSLTLSPAPILSVASMVRYSRIGTTTFTSSALSAVPDAPAEYHWLYVPGLCEKIAQALDDIAKANNYGAVLRNGLNVAAQNYQGAGSR